MGCGDHEDRRSEGQQDGVRHILADVRFGADTRHAERPIKDEASDGSGRSHDRSRCMYSYAQPLKHDE